MAGKSTEEQARLIPEDHGTCVWVVSWVTVYILRRKSVSRERHNVALVLCTYCGS